MAAPVRAEVPDLQRVVPGGALGQPEVQHPEPTVQGDQHVLRLEVPVQHALGMGFPEGVGDGAPHPQHVALGKGILLHALAEVLSLQVLQGHVGARDGLAHGVDGHDVRVVEARGDPRLP